MSCSSGKQAHLEKKREEKERKKKRKEKERKGKGKARRDLGRPWPMRRNRSGEESHRR